MKYTSEFVVRTYECDSYGHVNNAVYLNYLEFARMEYLHQIGFDYKNLIADGYYLYITHIDIYYKFSAFLDDHLCAEVEPVKLKTVSGTFHQVIRKADGTLCAEADVTWASVKTGGIPSKIPDKYLVRGLFPDGDPRLMKWEEEHQ
jgi:YbgC/YbaW family acyl-CoA thioester hydrolase